MVSGVINPPLYDPTPTPRCNKSCTVVNWNSETCSRAENCTSFDKTYGGNKREKLLSVGGELASFFFTIFLIIGPRNSRFKFIELIRFISCIMSFGPGS